MTEVEALYSETKNFEDGDEKRQLELGVYADPYRLQKKFEMWSELVNSNDKQTPVVVISCLVFAFREADRYCVIKAPEINNCFIKYI
jgi:hypothetical protein